MSAMKSVRFRQDQVSVFNGNNCPLSAGFSVRNHRNTHQERDLRGGTEKHIEQKSDYEFYHNGPFAWLIQYIAGIFKP
jgi:hypothetical protein